MKKILLLTLISTCFLLPLRAQKLDHVQGDIIVQIKPGESIRDLAAKLQYFNGKPTKLQIERELSPPLRIWLLSFDFTTIHEGHFLEAVKRSSQVEVAQYNHLIEMRETVPNDPSFSQQWQWVNTGQNGGTPDADVDADLAWDITTGGSTAIGQEIVVCVVEGANRNHVDLQGNLWFNSEEIPNNGIDDDGNGYIDDYNGWNPSTGNDNIPSASHGTTVSGMIGAKGNNSTLVTGINWNIKIMHVNVGSLNEANVIASYTYPLVMRRRYNLSGGTSGAFVVATNSSWGLDNADPASAPLWCAFYDSLGLEGILSCGATANNNVNIDVVGDLPTGCSSEYLISVTATNRNDVRTFSGYGTTHVDVGAPGEQIVSIGLNGGPNTTSGTSFATPLTAGIIALLYSAPCISIGPMALNDPAGTALLIRDALFQGVDVKPNLVNEVKTGGRVNAFNSLNILLESCGACPAPYGINLTNLIDTSATLTWNSTDSTLTTNLRWRVFGELIWIEKDNVSSPFVLSGLLACTTYEFQLQDICSDTISTYSNPFIFKTDGCCEAPKDLVVNGVTGTGATALWNSVLAANSYNLLLTTPAGPMFFEGLTGTQLELTGLEPCMDYTVQVQTVCDTGLTDFGTLIAFHTPGCGACTDLSYCNSNSANASNEWIANVTLGSINNTSGSNGGYGDFTGISTDLATYQAHPISLTPGFAGFGFNEWFKVWIDFNQDGDFNDPGEDTFNAGGTTQNTVTGQLIVPGTALPGLTRMRVVMKWSVQPTGPCVQNFDFGEVEDYCVNIVEGTPPNCLTPTALGAVNISYTNATLQWTGANDALSYSVRYRVQGTTNWVPVSAVSATVVVQNLLACTEYELQVRSVCVGTVSDWSEIFAFTTACFPPCDDIPTGLDTTNVTTSGAKLLWNLVANAQSYRLRYKQVNDVNWSTLQVNTNSHTLNGLTACKDYHYTVQALCPGNLESEFSGFFTFKTQCLTSTSEPKDDLEGVLVYPNPFTSAITLDVTLRRPKEVMIEMFDARGRRVYNLTRELAGGNQQVVLDEKSTGNLPGGVYLIKVSTGGGHSMLKVVKQ